MNQRQLSNQDCQGQDEQTHRQRMKTAGVFVWQFLLHNVADLTHDNLTKPGAEIRPFNTCFTKKKALDNQVFLSAVWVCVFCGTWCKVCASVWGGEMWSWSWHCWSSFVPSGHGSSLQNDCTLPRKTER